MQQIASLIQQYTPDAVELRRNLHRHPELSMKEVNTTRLIQETLQSYGIPLIQDVTLPSGTAALLQSGQPGKTLMLRADIDALPVQEKSGLPFASECPGVCHSCGHDIHTSALLLCARVLSQMREQLKGQVLFLFQPAEETGSGAAAVLESGLLEHYKPDLAIGAHCWPDLPGGTVGLRKGGFMASSDTFLIRVTGRGGHGAHPHKSIDPIVTACYLVGQLQSVVSRSVAPLDSAVVTIGKFTAGTAANVIPDEAVLEGTVRTVDPEIQALVEQRIRDISAHCAAAMGAQCEVEYHRGMPPLVCDPQVVDLLDAAASQQLGKEQVRYLEQPSMGSEDFARYLQQIPGAMFRIGTATDAPASHLPLHNAGILFDEQGIPTGASVMCQLALDYLR